MRPVPHHRLDKGPRSPVVQIARIDPVHGMARLAYLFRIEHDWGNAIPRFVELFDVLSGQHHFTPTPILDMVTP